MSIAFKGLRDNTFLISDLSTGLMKKQMMSYEGIHDIFSRKFDWGVNDPWNIWIYRVYWPVTKS